MVIESMHEKTDEAMCKLLQALFRSFVITIDQMKNVSILKWNLNTYLFLCFVLTRGHTVTNFLF